MSCRYSRALWNSSRFLSMRLMALMAGTELGLARSADWYACAASSGLLSASAKLPAPKGQIPERRKLFGESIVPICIQTASVRARICRDGAPP